METDRWQHLMNKMREGALSLPEVDELHQALEVLRLQALKDRDAGQVLILSFGQGMLNSMRVTLEQKAKA